MTTGPRFNSVNDAIRDWRKKHPLRTKSPKFKSVYFQLQTIIVLIAVVSVFHYPPVQALPHAEVLILDMTHQQDASRGIFLSLLDQAHISYVLYYSADINFFRMIPTGGYRIIIIWSHSGINDMATTEPYKIFGHVLEQLTGQVGDYLVEGKQYFSVGPGLINSMQGQLHGTLVFLMGCNTMTQPELAQAFIRKGSSLVVGWKGLVSLSATDTFAISLFQRVLQQNMAMNDAMSATKGDLASLGLPDILLTMSA